MRRLQERRLSNVSALDAAKGSSNTTLYFTPRFFFWFRMYIRGKTSIMVQRAD
jgi:hypothetical protein